MKKTITKIIFSVLLTLMFVSVAEAAIGIPEEYGPDNTPLDISFEEQVSTNTGSAEFTISILRIIAGALLYFAGPVAVIFIIINAIKMAGGGADSEQLEQAKKGLTWTLIGLLMIILSWSIVRTVIEITIDLADNTSSSSTTPTTPTTP